MTATALSDAQLLAFWLLLVLVPFGVASLDAVREVFPGGMLQLSELSRTRLYRMLLRRNVGIARYFQQTSPCQRSAQLRDCSACSNKSRCDAALASNDAADFSFCPSNGYLEKLARTP